MWHYHDLEKLREAEHNKLPVAPADTRPTIRRLLAQHGDSLDSLSHGVSTSLLSLVHSLRETSDFYLASPFTAEQQLDDLRKELIRLRDDARETLILAESVLVDL